MSGHPYDSIISPRGTARNADRKHSMWKLATAEAEKLSRLASNGSQQ